MPKNEWSYESPLTMPEIAGRIRMFCADARAAHDDPDWQNESVRFDVVREAAASATITVTGDWHATVTVRAQPILSGALVTATVLDLSHRKRFKNTLVRVARPVMLGRVVMAELEAVFGTEAPLREDGDAPDPPTLLEQQLALQPPGSPAAEIAGIQVAIGKHRRFMRQLVALWAVACTLFGASVWWQTYRNGEFVRTEQHVDARVAEILTDDTVVLRFELGGEARSVEVLEPEETYRRGQKVGIGASTANSKVEVPGEFGDDIPVLWIALSMLAAVWLGDVGVRRAWLLRRISSAARNGAARRLEHVLAVGSPPGATPIARSALVRFRDSGGTLLVRKCRARDWSHLRALETRPCWAIGPVGDPVALVTSDPNQVFIGACSPTHNPLRRWWWDRRLDKVERQRSVAG
jgi:hypothetical protein